MTHLQSFSEFERLGWEDSDVVKSYDEHLSRVTIQSIPQLLRAAGVRSGAKVLDVATGGGYMAVAASEMGADAIGIDFSTAQIELARRRNPSTRFEQADAVALPFPAASFDVVVSGFGICHFPDPDLALREMYRVLKPGGRVAFSVWDLPERAIGIGAAYAALRNHGSTDPGLPTGPDFFMFSDAGRSVKALVDAGFSAPTISRVPLTWHMSSPDQLFDLLAKSSVRAGAALRAQDQSSRSAIRRALRDTVSAYQRGAYYEVPMSAIIAAASKS